MMDLAGNPKLQRLYDFFKSYGTERLNGLDESYFCDLDADEKNAAWNFLSGHDFDEEIIKGLYLLDKDRAIALMKEALARPMGVTSSPAERRATESSRLLMLKYMNNAEPSEKNIDAMCEFASSEFEDVRGQLARSIPTHQVTPRAIETLKKMIFTETGRVPRTSAITKFMVIHGMDFDMDDPLYKSIYLALRSDNPKEKVLAMARLEKMGQPDYL